MHARKNKINFAWQARFHDHIIRDDDSFYRIQQYIENNVANWHDGQCLHLLSQHVDVAYIRYP